MLGLITDNLRYRLIDDNRRRFLGYDHCLRLLVYHNRGLCWLISDDNRRWLFGHNSHLHRLLINSSDNRRWLFGNHGRRWLFGDNLRYRPLDGNRNRLFNDDTHRPFNRHRRKIVRNGLLY